MQSKRVQERIRVEHEQLEELLLGVEKSARQVIDGEQNLLGALRVATEALERRLDDHMRWEDDVLRHALLEADALATPDVERIFDEHRIQREALCVALEAVESQSRPAVVIARSLLDLSLTLRREMKHEEQLLVRGMPTRMYLFPQNSNGTGHS